MTPDFAQPKLANALGLSNLVFKREDMHPYGSHKGRSIPHMINHYVDKGDKRFAISSSGNAALAAMLYIEELNKKFKANIALDIFVSLTVNEKKFQKLNVANDENIRIFKKEKPLQALIQAENDGWRSLRQSTDDVALAGYQSLAEELLKIKDISAVFVGTSSGTTAQALADYFLKNGEKIQVHIIQTSSCHPLVDGLKTYEGRQEKSLADAIVDHMAYRKETLIPLLRQTGGTGWFADNEAIQTAAELSKKHTDTEVSFNSCLSICGLMQASYESYDIGGGIPVCLVCGD